MGLLKAVFAGEDASELSRRRRDLALRYVRGHLQDVLLVVVGRRRRMAGSFILLLLDSVLDRGFVRGEVIPPPQCGQTHQTSRAYLVSLALRDDSLLLEELRNVGRLHDRATDEVIELAGQRAHVLGRGEHEIHLADVQRGA